MLRRTSVANCFHGKAVPTTHSVSDWKFKIFGTCNYLPFVRVPINFHYKFDSKFFFHRHPRLQLNFDDDDDGDVGAALAWISAAMTWWLWRHHHSCKSCLFVSSFSVDKQLILPSPRVPPSMISSLMTSSSRCCCYCCLLVILRKVTNVIIQGPTPHPTLPTVTCYWILLLCLFVVVSFLWLFVCLSVGFLVSNYHISGQQFLHQTH